MSKNRGLSLQTIHRKVRELFVPTPGYKYISFDLSQVEARIVSCLIPNNDTLFNFFVSGKDVHAEVAGIVFDVDPSTLTKASPQREISKKLVHGGNYGLEPYNFSKIAKISLPDAHRHLNNYLDLFGIRDWWLDVVSRLNQNRTLSTVYGRRLTIFGSWTPSKTSNKWLQDEKVLNEAYAFEPQATAVDFINLAIIRIKKRMPDIIPLIQMHDEWIIECPASQTEELKVVIKNEIHKSIKIRDKTLIIPCSITEADRWK